MPRSLSGSRIRETRRRAGITQAALARQAGISPSYLNLIEHNRRGIGGAVLNAIAEALGTRASELAEGGSPTLIADLRAAAADFPGGAADASEAEALAGRFPDWASLIVGQQRRIRDLTATIGALSDRLAHDPFLAENVHAMLSHITAIRSTSAILAQVRDIPADRQERFHDNIHAESLKLSATATQLAEYLGAAASRADLAATAEEALDHFLTRNSFRFPLLDADPQTDLAALLDSDPEVGSGEARSLAEAHLRRYAADAAAMPLEAFAEQARDLQYDPGRLATRFAQPVPAVFRRLAVLRRPGIDAPRFGLIVVSASGYPLQRQPLPDFPMPRHGNACPLWPVFDAFARPMQPVIARIRQAGGTTFTALAYALPPAEPDFGAEPQGLVSSMLVLSEAVENAWSRPQRAARDVGTSCRICSRQSCAARSQPPLLAG